MVTRKDDPMVVSLVEMLNRKDKNRGVDPLSADEMVQSFHEVIEFTPISPTSRLQQMQLSSQRSAHSFEVLCQAAECSLNLCGERALALHYSLHRVRLSLMSIRAEMQDTITPRHNRSSTGGEATPTAPQPALISQASIRRLVHDAVTMAQFVAQLGSDVEQATHLLTQIVKTLETSSTPTTPNPSSAA